MPICRKCFAPFPNVLVIGDKERYLNSRKFCLTCSPFGSRNRRPLDLGDKNERCIFCSKPTIRGRKLCGGCISKARRNRVKLAAIRYKGGKCQRCGWSGHPSGFDFHHRELGAKEYSITAHSNRSLSALKKELDKCDLVCALCHRLIHHDSDAAFDAYVADDEFDFTDL